MVSGCRRITGKGQGSHWQLNRGTIVPSQKGAVELRLAAPFNVNR